MPFHLQGICPAETSCPVTLVSCTGIGILRSPLGLYPCSLPFCPSLVYRVQWKIPTVVILGVAQYKVLASSGHSWPNTSATSNRPYIHLIVQDIKKPTKVRSTERILSASEEGTWQTLRRIIIFIRIGPVRVSPQPTLSFTTNGVVRNGTRGFRYCHARETRVRVQLVIKPPSNMNRFVILRPPSPCIQHAASGARTARPHRTVSHPITRLHFPVTKYGVILLLSPRT